MDNQNILPVKKKRKNKNLVAIGTYVPMLTKLAFQDAAEAMGKTVYERLQELIQEDVEDYKSGIQVPEETKSDDELLG